MTATNSAPSTTTTSNHGVNVYLGLGLCGDSVLIDVDQIKAIIPIGECQRVPLVKSWIRGIANWQGKFVTVLDVCELFGGQSQRSHNQTQLIVVEHQRFLYGLLFQSIYEKLPIDNDLWKKYPHNHCSGAIRGCVNGHVEIAGCIWHRLDLKELFEQPKLFNILSSS